MKASRAWSVLVVGAVLAVVAYAAPVEAAFPGQSTLIAFERQRAGGSSGSMGIWTMKPDGSAQALLLEVGQSTTDPAWSPDMDPAAGYQGKLAFIADGDVWTANADGSNPTNLTNSSAASSAERDPAWSPDLDPATSGYQGRIAYASIRTPCTACPSNEDVYTIDATGGGELRLTEEANSDREPAWSPSGTEIAFWSNRSPSLAYPGGVGLYVMSATGSGEGKLRANTPDDVPTNASFPNWSPDGSRLAVNGDANHPGIRVVDRASGTISGQLSAYPSSTGGAVNSPAYSPQGDRIAFVQRPPGAPANDFDIVVMDASGGNATNLTGSAGTRDEDPDWQPAAAPLDTTAPTVPSLSKPSSAFPKNTSFPVAWSATDGGVLLGGTAGGTYNVRYRTATSTNATFTPYVWWLKATTARSATFAGARGVTYCFSVMARDRSGNVSAFSADRCTAVPLDDAPLVASAGWTRVPSGASGYYLGSYSATTANGATLTIANLRAKRLALLATKSPTAGTITIAWNGTVLRQVSLTATTTVKKSLIQLTPFTSVQTGTVTIKVTSTGKRVEIDGLGASAV